MLQDCKNTWFSTQIRYNLGLHHLLGEVLVSIGRYGKAPADVIDWERHLIMGLYTARLVVWDLKTAKFVIRLNLLAVAI